MLKEPISKNYVDPNGTGLTGGIRIQCLSAPDRSGQLLELTAWRTRPLAAAPQSIFVPDRSGQLLELEQLEELLLGQFGGLGHQQLRDNGLVLQAGQHLLHPQHVAHLQELDNEMT